MGKHGNHPSADSPFCWVDTRCFAVPSNSFLYSTWIQQALVESFSVMLSCDQGKMWRWTATKYKDMLYVAISRSYKTLRCFRSSQCVLNMSHLARFFFGAMKTCRSLWVPLCWHENSRFKVQSRFVLFQALSCCVFEMQNPLIIHSNPPTPLWRWRRAYWGATATLNAQWHLLI